MIRIIGDTTSGLSLQQAQELGIEFIPQLVVFGEKTFRDDYEIDSATFVKMLTEAKELPKTAAPPPALYTPIFEDMQQKGDSAIIICPSQELSGTVRSAQTALADFPNLDVRIVNSKTIGGNIATLLKLAKKWADEGKTLDEIEKDILEKVEHGKLYALVDTLEYLHKGGRIGGASKFFGELLQIKPILAVTEGRVEAFEKQRTKKRAIARVLELLEQECKDYKQAYFTLSMLDSNPEINFLKKEFKERFETDNIPFLNVPPAIMVHAGPGVILFSFFTE